MVASGFRWSTRSGSCPQIGTLLGDRAELEFEVFHVVDYHALFLGRSFGRGLAAALATCATRDRMAIAFRRKVGYGVDNTRRWS
jgi:hypothetical protein